MNYDRIILSIINDIALIKDKIERLENQITHGKNNPFESQTDERAIDKKYLSFIDYLTKVRGMKITSARSRLSNCNRISQYEGNIEEQYDKDKCKALLKKLEYSRDDYRNNVNTFHKVPIRGNKYNGTATLKQAVRLFVEYQDYLNSATK